MAQDSNNYWEQLERLEKLIRASELKSGVVFSFHSLILGLFADRIDYIRPIIQNDLILIVLSSVWIVAVLISVYYCFKCFKPQLDLEFDKNVFYFRDAAREFGNRHQFSKKLMSVCETEDELCDKLSQQIQAESIIIDQKFICVKRSIQGFGISIIMLIIMLGYSLF
ncbi:hypothetical protein VDG1235_3484 [Verrucomicrobiia bacterium DG1235]|nr:hypothetical protein VDG1235_3484 [Verrucomicrobiae bacterium DG1235]